MDIRVQSGVVDVALDYLLSEDRPAGCKVREIQFNGQSHALMSIMQDDHDDHHCQFLRFPSGRCGIHHHNPFSCDFELIRFAKFADDARPNQVTTRLFGRGWQLLRVDGERGAACKMTPKTPESLADTIRKLERLELWMKTFGLQSKIQQIIKWLKTFPTEAIIL